MEKSKWDSGRLYGFESERIKFTKMRIENSNAIHVMASNPEVSKYIGWPLTESLSQTRTYVEEMLRREEAGSFKYANIEDKRFGNVIGTVMLFGHDEDARHAEVGYVIEKSVWGKGIGTEVVELAKQVAFNTLGLRKLHARVVGENVGSSRILEKNGFVKEGCLKDYYNIDGVFMDCVLYGGFDEA